MINIKLPVIFLLLCTTLFGCIEPKDCNLLPEATGKLTITDIPEEHIGKYIWVDIHFLGLTSNLGRAFGLTRTSNLYPNIKYYLINISDETIIIPLYIIDYDNPNKYYSFDFNGTSSYSFFSCILNDIEYLTIEDTASLYASVGIYGKTSNIQIDDYILKPIASGDFIDGNFTIPWIKTGIEENE